MAQKICIVLNADGLIVNRIVIDENTPTDFSPGPGLAMSDTTEAPIEVPVLDPETAEPTGETQTVIVPMAIGGAYINGVYTPPQEEN